MNIFYKTIILISFLINIATAVFIIIISSRLSNINNSVDNIEWTINSIEDDINEVKDYVHY